MGIAIRTAILFAVLIAMVGGCNTGRPVPAKGTAPVATPAALASPEIDAVAKVRREKGAKTVRSAKALGDDPMYNLDIRTPTDEHRYLMRFDGSRVILELAEQVQSLERDLALLRAQVNGTTVDLSISEPQSHSRKAAKEAAAVADQEKAVGPSDKPGYADRNRLAAETAAAFAMKKRMLEAEQARPADPVWSKYSAEV